MTSSAAGDPADPVGSAAEEAARLLGAVQDWMRRSGEDSGDHVATGSAECRLCPVCRLLSLLREGQPEVAEHLGRATESLVAALRAAIVAHEKHWADGEQPPVQHIDIG